MSETDTTRPRPVRIGTCSGFYGDRASALAEMAAAGDVDVIVGDYLAEVTMLILGKAQAKDPSKGYATTFLSHLKAALEDVVAKNIKIVVNAGGLNPAGLAEAVRELLAEAGHSLRVSHLLGDDITQRLPALTASGHGLAHLKTGRPLSTWKHTPMTANAYLGGFGIALALEGGADIVITGRVADASLITGVSAWWWAWTPHDYDQLAGGIVAGHVIECGTQATGGNFAGFTTLADMDSPGFPIAEIDEDGSAVITKVAGTGGAVTADTVTAQLLYEIKSPAYHNADVTSHFDTTRVEQHGPDRVGLSGTRGTPPPPTTVVSATAIGGWKNTMFFAATGSDIDAKQANIERFLHGYTDGNEEITAVAVDRIGRAQEDPSTENEGTVIIRVSVQGSKEAAGRAFSTRMIELALAGYPGLFTLAPPGSGSAYGVYWPGLIEQSELVETVVNDDGSRVEVRSPDHDRTASPDTAEVSPTTDDEAGSVPSGAETVEVTFGDLVYARSGDKGGDANIGVWPRDERIWPWLRAFLTVSQLRRLLPETEELEVERFELGNLPALNFLVTGILDQGATSTLRLDSQGKALGEWLRSRRVKVPIART
jgi:hypothetical protein